MFKCSNVKIEEKGFILIELLVVIGIIFILSGIILIDYRSGQKQLALQRAASKLAQDIRRTQEMAMSMKEYTLCSGGVFPTGYGILFDSNQESVYYIFTDCDDNQVWDINLDGDVATIQIEKGITIDNFSGSSQFLDIIFTSPDPTATICGCDTATDCFCSLYSSMWIDLCIEESNCSDPANTKRVKVNEIGRVEIDQ